MVKQFYPLQNKLKIAVFRPYRGDLHALTLQGTVLANMAVV
jgi:hypothetical protein